MKVVVEPLLIVNEISLPTKLSTPDTAPPVMENVCVVPPMVMILDPEGLKVPDVSVTFPVTVISELIATPPEPFSVKLRTLPVNMDAGSVMPDVLVNSTVALLLLASILPVDLVGELPLMVSVFAPTVNVPEVRASVPAAVVLDPKVIPPPFTVMLLTFPLNKDAGNVNPLAFVKVIAPDALLASIFPLDLEIEEPE